MPSHHSGSGSPASNPSASRRREGQEPRGDAMRRYHNTYDPSEKFRTGGSAARQSNTLLASRVAALESMIKGTRR